MIIALMVFELAGTIAALTLFGIADPDLFRTTLWGVGYDNGFNSSPLQVLYAYANYQPIPKIPFVWSQTYVSWQLSFHERDADEWNRLTSFNVGISVLSTFLLLTKSVMFTMHVWFPILGTVINAALTILWVVSTYGQAGPDYSDPEHPSKVAWYVSKSCHMQSHMDSSITV